MATATALSGTLAQFYSADRETGYFGPLGLVAIVLGVVLALVSRPLRRLMSGVH